MLDFEQRRKLMNLISPDCFDDMEKEAVFHNLNLMYERVVNELQGIAHAVCFDKRLADDELKMLLAWFLRNQYFSSFWPISDIEALFLELSKKDNISEEWRPEFFILHAP